MVNHADYPQAPATFSEEFRNEYQVHVNGHQHITNDGYEYSPVPQNETEIPDDAPALGQMLALRGLSRRQQLEAEYAKYDELTGALREKEFIKLIEADLAASPNKKRGMIFVDLGNFKKANTFGQAVGDDVLRMVVEKFRRDGDLVARLGGDELAIYFNADPRRGDKRNTKEIIQDEVTWISNTRTAVVEKYPELDKGKVRFFISAGGIEYDQSIPYATNRQIANIEADSAKEVGHERYGAYRVVEDDIAA